MTAGFGIKVLLEIGVVVLIAYGYLHEDKLIAFERELFAILKFCVKKYILGTTKTNKTNRTQQNRVQAQQNISRTNAQASVRKHRAEIKMFPGVVAEDRTFVA